MTSQSNPAPSGGNPVQVISKGMGYAVGKTSLSGPIHDRKTIARRGNKTIDERNGQGAA